MKQKLFSNVGGNQFRLITESVEYNSDKPYGHEQVREGLKKVLSNGGKEISYKRLQNVGLGYIKDVTQAARCALREAKALAEEFGYQDDEQQQKFVKENDFSKLSAENPEHRMAQVGSDEGGHDESDTSSSEETREVQIAKEILSITSKYGLKTSQHDLPEESSKAGFNKIGELANELIQMHGGQ